MARYNSGQELSKLQLHEFWLYAELTPDQVKDYILKIRPGESVWSHHDANQFLLYSVDYKESTEKGRFTTVAKHMSLSALWSEAELKPSIVLEEILKVESTDDLADRPYLQHQCPLKVTPKNHSSQYFHRSDGGRNSQRGFKFLDRKEQEPSEGLAEATPVGKKKTGTHATDNTFLCCVRKDDEKDISKEHAGDVAGVSATIRARQEKAQLAGMRRLLRQKKRDEATREATNEEYMKHKKLSADQISLYHMVQRQVKRDLRKVRKEFLISSACQDIMQLSEISLQAMKHGQLVYKC
ncbi:hypothetical protein PsorP6_006221 [Peronosclerospora sorghi]|uniref:Uncharacterized protein n=1 Tax=Peronosclerospora sorghi TaxID=230839 RepID=A0ACC0W4D6_9STRA|nr:hypothetical protein PsorP6_006221 [Peronosclerospora sorghi]